MGLLLVGAGGEALSKRIGSLSLQEIRADGIEPLALACYLAKTGTSDAIELRFSLDMLVQEFDFAKIGRAPAHFDPAELKGLNAKLLHSLPYTDIRERLAGLGIPANEAFWEAIKANLTQLSDATDLWSLVTGPVTPVIEDAALLAKAAAHGLRALSLWLAVLPTMCIPFLLGGVSWKEAVLSMTVKTVPSGGTKPIVSGSAAWSPLPSCTRPATFT